MTEKKVYEYDGLVETVNFAESLGWVDTYGDADDGDWDEDIADCCEHEALEFIKSKGYVVMCGGEEL